MLIEGIFARRNFLRDRNNDRLETCGRRFEDRRGGGVQNRFSREILEIEPEIERCWPVEHDGTIGFDRYRLVAADDDGRVKINSQLDALCKFYAVNTINIDGRFRERHVQHPILYCCRNRISLQINDFGISRNRKRDGLLAFDDVSGDNILHVFVLEMI